MTDNIGDHIREWLKKEKKADIIEEYVRQEAELQRAYQERNEMRDALKKQVQTQLANNKPDYPVNVSLSLDLWPPKDWFRFQVENSWNVRYFQVNLGPLRLDIFE